jgi:hypothetical protein
VRGAAGAAAVAGEEIRGCRFGMGMGGFGNWLVRGGICKFVVINYFLGFFPVDCFPCCIGCG